MKGPVTLGRVFYFSIAALVLLLGSLFYVLLTGSRRAIVENAVSLRESAIDRVAKRVQDYLYQAEETTNELEHAFLVGSCDATNAGSVESCLVAAILARRDLAEVTFTRATRRGFDAEGRSDLGPDRWQTSIFRREAARGSPICTRYTHGEAGRFMAEVRCRSEAASLLPAPPPVRLPTLVADPTDHLTFSTPASASSDGTAIWTDLSYAELDSELPPPERRIVVTVMKTIADQRGEFAGVLRVGLLANRIDQAIADIKVNAGKDDPYRIFLCDGDGRLVARLSADDRMVTFDDDLRIVAASMPAEISAAIRQPVLGEVAKARNEAHAEFPFDGRKFYVSFRALEHSQGWNVGVVGPEDYYLQSLRRTMRSLLAMTLAVCAIVVVGGVLTLRAIRGGLRRITRETERMHAFDFSPSETDSPFSDVSSVLAGLERAKTAVRAMGRYVPIDLVRQLFAANREPTLGGSLADVSLMFTDVKDFTSLAERLPPDELARLLGHYFEAMTTAVHGVEGTVDKYIGDAVMAIWNAPRPCVDHAQKACTAVLACIAATQKLFSSPAWAGAPPLVTRFGLHRDRVMVGHFGAPDRMSYTALGDGVNLAARLEGLNKQYGTTVLASDAIFQEAKGAFAFRHVDRVAVKGRSSGVDVYELLGTRAQGTAFATRMRTYEDALAAYMGRDFRAAIALLDGQLDDGPSAVLSSRCQTLIVRPPAPDWDGIFVASSK